MRRDPEIFALLAVASMLSAQPASADTVILRPVADTTLIQVAPSNNLGASLFFNAGTTQNGTYNHGLLQFDPVSQIPLGATIQSVTLVLNVVHQPVDGYNFGDFELARVLAPWLEGNKTGTPASPGFGATASPGEATWQGWSQPGGDYAPQPSSLQAVFRPGDSPYLFGNTSNMVADVQQWLNNPGQNHGWLLRPVDESVRFTARRFASREDLNNAPELIIDFVPVPEPTPLALAALGTVLYLRFRSRKDAARVGKS